MTSSRADGCVRCCLMIIMSVFSCIQLATLTWNAVSYLWLVHVCCFLCQNIDFLGFMPNKQLADFVWGRILLWFQEYIGRFFTLCFFIWRWEVGGWWWHERPNWCPDCCSHFSGRSVVRCSVSLSRLPPNVQFKFSCFSKKLFSLFLIYKFLFAITFAESAIVYFISLGCSPGV
jgi:hypothetical protein